MKKICKTANVSIFAIADFIGLTPTEVQKKIDKKLQL